MSASRSPLISSTEAGEGAAKDMAKRMRCLLIVGKEDADVHITYSCIPTKMRAFTRSLLSGRVPFSALGVIRALVACLAFWMHAVLQAACKAPWAQRSWTARSELFSSVSKLWVPVIKNWVEGALCLPGFGFTPKPLPAFAGFFSMMFKRDAEKSLSATGRCPDSCVPSYSSDNLNLWRLDQEAATGYHLIWRRHA